MSVKKDLQAIRAIGRQLQHVEYQMEKEGKTEQLYERWKDINSKFLPYYFTERYVKIENMIESFAKTVGIEPKDVKIKSKLLHNPGTKSKNEVLKLLRECGDYYRVNVELIGGGRKIFFDFLGEPDKVLPDGTKQYKHIKVNKNGDVWINPTAIPMFETNNVLADNIDLMPYKKDEEGNLIEESCGKLYSRNLFGKVFVNALLLEEKKNEKIGENGGEERE